MTKYLQSNLMSIEQTDAQQEVIPPLSNQSVVFDSAIPAENIQKPEQQPLPDRVIQKEQIECKQQAKNVIKEEVSLIKSMSLVILQPERVQTMSSSPQKQTNQSIGKQNPLLISINSAIVESEDTNIGETSEKKVIQRNINEETVQVQTTKKLQENVLEEMELPLQTLFQSVKSEEYCVDPTSDKKKLLQSTALVETSAFKKHGMSLIHNFSLVVSPLSEKKVSTQEEKSKQEKNGIEKHTPLDLKSLSVLSLSSVDATKSIKPSSPKGERTLKPWQKAKKMRELREDVVKIKAQQEKAGIANNDSLLLSLKNEGLPYIKPEDLPKLNKQNQIKDVKQQNTKVEEGVNQPEKHDFLPLMSPQTPELLQTNSLEEPITSSIELLRESASNPQQIINKEKQIAPNASSLHPFLRHHPLQIKSRQEQKMSQSHGLRKYQQRLENNQQSFPSIKQVDQRNKDEKTESLPKLKQSLSDGSFFEEKKQENVQQLKRRLEQLQNQIKTQRNIREHLEVSTPVSLKLVVSFIAGSVVGGMSFALRKQRLGSIVLGVATGVSTFLLTK